MTTISIRDIESFSFYQIILYNGDIYYVTLSNYHYLRLMLFFKNDIKNVFYYTKEDIKRASDENLERVPFELGSLTVNFETYDFEKDIFNFYKFKYNYEVLIMKYLSREVKIDETFRKKWTTEKKKIFSKI